MGEPPSLTGTQAASATYPGLGVVGEPMGERLDGGEGVWTDIAAKNVRSDNKFLRTPNLLVRTKWS